MASKIDIPNEKRVTFINNKDNKRWKNWKQYKECTEEEVKNINLRELRDDEIVLDYEHEEYNKYIKKLERDGYTNYIIIKTNSRGAHVHLFFDNIEDLDKETRKEVRKLFIRNYEADESKSSDNTLISIENRPHFKTLNNTEIIVDNFKSKNLLSNGYIMNGFKVANKLDSTNKNIQPDMNFKDYHKSDPFFKLFQAGIKKQDCEKNNVVFKNIAVGLVKEGLSDKEIQDIVKPIIDNKYTDKNYAEFRGWVEKARKGELSDYNKGEIVNWCKKYGFDNVYKQENNEDNNTSKENLSNVFTFFTNQKRKVAKEYVKRYPIYYDRSRLWWKWNFNEMKWDRVEETDILNAISNTAVADTVKSTDKTEILEALKQAGRENEPLKPNKYWVQFYDTIVNIKTGEKFKATPKYFMTNVVPWKLGNSEETPTIDKIFREWVVRDGIQDESYIDTLYEIASYAILNHYPIHRVFCLFGEGLNGKSCYEKFVSNFVGKDNTTNVDLNLLKSSRFETSKLYRKNVCYINEIDTGYFTSTSNFKKVTGDDEIRAEFKGKDGFDFFNYAKVIISTNTLPETGDKTVGFYRRWLTVDFPNTFTERKDILAEIPEQEYRNLALKSIKILKRVLERGAFTNEGTLEQRKAKYEKRSNPMGKFIEEFCDQDPNGFVRYSDFYENFIDYLRSRKLRSQSKVEVGRTLENLGYKRRNKTWKDENGYKQNGFVVEGIQWKNKEDATSDAPISMSNIT